MSDVVTETPPVNVPKAGSFVGAAHPNSPDAGHRVGLVVRTSKNEYSDGTSEDFIEVAWLPTEVLRPSDVYEFQAGAVAVDASKTIVGSSQDAATSLAPPPSYQ